MIGPKSFNQSKDCKGKVLVQICPKVALEMIKCEKYLSHICAPAICSQDSYSWITIIYAFVKELLKSICWTHQRERVMSANKFNFFHLLEKQPGSLHGKLKYFGQEKKTLKRKVMIILTSC